MSHFKIGWRRTALDELANAWMAVANRSEVTSAHDSIERKLRDAPAKNCTGEVEGLYFLDEPPLRVGYTIDNTSRRVTIVGLSYRAR